MFEKGKRKSSQTIQTLQTKNKRSWLDSLHEQDQVRSDLKRWHGCRNNESVCGRYIEILLWWLKKMQDE